MWCGFFLLDSAAERKFDAHLNGAKGEREQIYLSLCTFLMYFINGFLIDEENNGAEAIKLSTNARVEDERGIKA